MAQTIPCILTYARDLRHSETAAEIRLWQHLRDRRLVGHKFVRQLPIGNFIADFACRSAKLIVEVDGATHGDAHEIAYDEKRTTIFESQGWRVLRICNGDVFKNMVGVLEFILQELES